MKPEIIFVSEKDGMITMSKDDLQNLIDRAYSAGYSDGLDMSKPVTVPYDSPGLPPNVIYCRTDGR